ncbi:hypothetical protein SSTU70S_03461 [Stutzerimonas stutzeri]
MLGWLTSKRSTARLTPSTSERCIRPRRHQQAGFDIQGDGLERGTLLLGQWGVLRQLTTQFFELRLQIMCRHVAFPLMVAKRHGGKPC